MRLSGETVFVAFDTQGRLCGVFTTREAAEAFLRGVIAGHQIARYVRACILDEP